MKVCRKCGKSLPLDRFAVCKYRVNGSPIYRGACRACQNAEHAARLKRDAVQAQRKRDRDRRWRQANPDKAVEYRARQKANLQAASRRRVEALSDSYIRNQLGLRVTDEVPQDLIEAKRWQIKTQRLLEEMGHEKRRRVAGRFS